ncbi:hypothetical protein M9H77_35243 [Catharanthus roseus]|uniref:Uncharacterized protein n=1 Tax=Catharanthus roseus TaxID=4058 RepID=A0ACB9ZQC5_CATRO|nr:hypothetical protein M9H77_35243 [Catharanthus roseus]
MNHTTGKWSFEQAGVEMVIPIYKLYEFLLDLPIIEYLLYFKKCYTHKDGTPCSSKYAIDECACQLPPNSQDLVGPNDSFAQVMGDARNDKSADDGTRFHLKRFLIEYFKSNKPC